MRLSIKLLITGFLLVYTFCLFAEIPIRTSANPDKGCAVAYNSQNDEYLVVWTEWKPSGSGTLPVMGQRVKGDGTGVIGSAFMIFPVGVYPSVAYNSQSNEYLVTLAAFGIIQGQRVTSTGALQGSSVVLMGNGSHAIWPKIVYNTLANNYLLVGAELFNIGNDIGNIKIYTRKITANGQPTGTENAIRDQGHGNYNDGARFSVAYAPVVSTETPNGRYLLVIEEPADLTMLDDNGVIVSKVVDSHSGTIVDNHVPFQQSKIGVPHNVDIAYGDWEGYPSFMVVWGDRDKMVGEQEWSGIWGGIVSAETILFDAHGGVSNEVFPISKIPFHRDDVIHFKEWKPAVAYNKPAGKFMVAWRETPSQDPLNDTKVNHIRANAVESSMIPPPDNVVLSAISGNEDPKNPAIAASTKSPNALVVWDDNRNSATTQTDVYGSLYATTPVPSLKVNEPNGGEKWYVGSQREVWWSGQNFNGPVKIEYSTNGGSTWKTLTSSTTDHTFPWTIPDEPASNCLVRVSDAADGNPSDISDSKFSILKAGLTLTSPNGGEKWAVGSQQMIKWSSQNIPDNDVSIEYSIDNGQNYTYIGVKTNNDPTETWQWDAVPNAPSKNCLIRISLFMQSAPVVDVSDAVFEITTVNTPQGSGVNVDVGSGIKLTFDNVTKSGNTTLDIKNSGPPPKSGFKIVPSASPVYYDINTDANYTGNITVCIPYNDAGMTPAEEAKLRLHVYESPPGQWKDITKLPVDVNNNIICGTVTHLTVFAMMLGPSHFTFTSPTQESYSIVVDNATLDGTQLTNGDEVGVFTPAGLCVGASLWDGTTPLGLTAWADDSQTPGVVDGYKSGEKMSFRIWDASTGSNDDYTAKATYSFGSGNFGDGAYARISLLAAVTSVTQALSLSQGWSWISFNVAPQDLTIDKVLAGMNNLEIVVNGAGDFYVPNLINKIGQLNMVEGYKIYLKAPDQVSVTGVPVEATTPIIMKAGWNFISYLPTVTIPVETALASILSNLDIIKNDKGDFFIPNLLNNLGNMTPGEGYKLYLKSDATLIYPQSMSLAKTSAITPVTQIMRPQHFKFRARTGESYSVVIYSLKVHGQALEKGDEIGIFTTAGLCVGAGVWDGSGALGISAWVDDDRTDELDGYRTGEEMRFKFWDRDIGQEIDLNATFTKSSGKFADEAFAVVELESVEVPTNFSLAQNYPNPFNAGTVISYHLPEAGRVELKLYNLLGEEIRALVDAEKAAGSHMVNWDGLDNIGKSVPSGIYIYRIMSGAFSAVKKAVYVK